MMTKVFVYGTLKQGYGNHGLLNDAKYLGDAVTVGKYRLLNAGFPVIRPGDVGRVEGEVYEVNRHTLQALDRLEGEGTMYHRKDIHVEMDDGSISKVQTYIGGDQWDQFNRPEYEVQPNGNLVWSRS